MLPPVRVWSRAEMLKRVARFKDLQGCREGLQDSGVPECGKTVFNVLGQSVATVLNRELQAGQHRILWEARADNGVALVSGVYFVQMEALGNTEVQKIVLLR